LNYSTPGIAVALFVRHPVAGRVKTRLARDVGDVSACELYQAMVADCVRNTLSAGLPLYLFHDGHDAAGLPQTWIHAAAGVISQVGETLGDRMTAAFEFLFSIGIAGVILTGSDIPGVDEALLRSASTAIKEHDVVFSPAFDGGYCLVAARKKRFNRSIFRDIPWSSSSVMETTLLRSNAAGLSYAFLDYRQDIDTIDDIRAYCGQPSPNAVFTNNWMTSHDYMVVSVKD
jgi:rSAM/selenodomain-associated transferase 1